MRAAARAVDARGHRQPIKFAGPGGAIDKLEGFHPERVAGRILGMGDLVSLSSGGRDDPGRRSRGNGEEDGQGPVRTSTISETSFSRCSAWAGLARLPA